MFGMGVYEPLRPGRQKESFDAVAEYYDLYRAGYPDDVVDAVIAISRLSAGTRVLEIGCGTGQLSVPLARHGVELVAVELGPHLASRARQNLAAFPNARVEVTSFEDWPLPKQRFDVVMSASALHWVDPDVRFAKSAEALRPGGFLTIVHVHHVRGGTPGFFEDTQPYYMKWGLSDDPFFQPPTPAEAPKMYPELGQLEQFSSVERHRLEIPRTHSSESYVGWLNTDSFILSLEKEARRGFLRDIEQLIDSRYHGHVSRNFVYEITLAQRTS
jgi:SAM-dependent methyltransferase